MSPQRRRITLEDRGTDDVHNAEAHMLGVLLESKANHQKRNGGAMLSVVVHTAIIGSVALGATPHQRPVPETGDVPRPFFVSPAPVHRVAAASTREVSVAQRSLMTIRAPSLVPTVLPPVVHMSVMIDDPSDVLIGSADRAGVSPHAVADIGQGDPPDADWSGSEALVHLRATVSPRYPEVLRRAGVSGRVVLRFAVDTTGRVDIASVQVVEATHDEFTRAVREVLPRLRFEPSRSNGRAVVATAEMPFVFELR